jgi:hypothetical protein
LTSVAVGGRTWPNCRVNSSSRRCCSASLLAISGGIGQTSAFVTRICCLSGCATGGILRTPWHFLYFLPLPHGQSSFRLILDIDSSERKRVSPFSSPCRDCLRFQGRSHLAALRTACSLTFPVSFLIVLNSALGENCGIVLGRFLFNVSPLFWRISPDFGGAASLWR